jgi:hypothetical protein
MAHCSAGIEMATGNIRLRRVFIGRILGPLIKNKAFKDHEPMRKNSPTAKELLVPGDRDFQVSDNICWN